MSDDAANSFFPSMAKPQDGEPAAPAPTRTWAQSPPDTAEKFFGGTAYQEITLHEAQDLLQPVDEFNNAWRGAMTELSVSNPEAAELTMLLKPYLRTPADQETQERWRRDASDALTRKHGYEEARKRFDAANALAKRSPTFIKAIKDAGLASHPRVVELLAERSHSLRALGKL